MEIISIEGRTYDEMMNRFEEFIRKVDTLCDKGGNKTMGKWLDAQDVCMILNISPRSLQTLRDSRKLAYTMIGHKIYYKPEDVQNVISKNTARKEVQDV